uniref:Uncharacterized protein n=1 Tax=Tetraselmis sp. GSL018 TaxID=582737 RepID=A0A061S9P0_9CHLO|mmetsp:Transcript_20424/g.48625  ORF Transcript_20424/g.48625 Transcript_20424/m.48625 type:complete len:401 (+) Transcript_20424:416-1618(+)|eukprot:CAMPEP_0177593166 /NCGR_PEP_ID=MMETSP0419_2-20121207/8984_1 /TAXON_ID=582737 /ORGANISM="Tetraselmis sp., Strain GSL018" /LENGTH=400 /DNA_ID=CAMNT_0019084153 /DNA_START=323 /DNA_END=1525 /DNA_ORIENTATION=-
MSLDEERILDTEDRPQRLRWDASNLLRLAEAVEEVDIAKHWTHGLKTKFWYQVLEKIFDEEYKKKYIEPHINSISAKFYEMYDAYVAGVQGCEVTYASDKGTIYRPKISYDDLTPELRTVLHRVMGTFEEIRARSVAGRKRSFSAPAKSEDKVASGGGDCATEGSRFACRSFPDEKDGKQLAAEGFPRPSDKEDMAGPSQPVPAPFSHARDGWSESDCDPGPVKKKSAVEGPFWQSQMKSQCEEMDSIPGVSQRTVPRGFLGSHHLDAHSSYMAAAYAPRYLNSDMETLISARENRIDADAWHKESAYSPREELPSRSEHEKLKALLLSANERVEALSNLYNLQRIEEQHQWACLYDELRHQTKMLERIHASREKNWQELKSKIDQNHSVIEMLMRYMAQ